MITMSLWNLISLLEYKWKIKSKVSRDTMATSYQFLIKYIFRIDNRRQSVLCGILLSSLAIVSRLTCYI